MRLRFLKPLPASLLALALVGLTILGLLRLQEWVTRLEGGYVHPYTIVFLLPIALLTVLGGRRVGFFTLTLCFLSSLCVLTAPRYSLPIHHPSDWAELFFLLTTGGILVLGMDALRRNLELFGETQKARARLQAVMDTSPIGILTCDLNGTLDYANAQAERIWGHPFVPASHRSGGDTGCWTRTGRRRRRTGRLWRGCWPGSAEPEPRIDRRAAGRHPGLGRETPALMRDGEHAHRRLGDDDGNHPAQAGGNRVGAIARRDTRLPRPCKARCAPDCRNGCRGWT